MSRGNFRQTIHKLSPLIEIVNKSNPCLYKLKGAAIRKNPQRITNHPTGDKMIQFLKGLRQKTPQIHDIKGKFPSNVHKCLCSRGEIPHKQNKGFRLSFRLDYNILAKVQIYPHTVQFDLGCSNDPLVYDISGIIQLVSVLSQLKTFLSLHSDGRCGFPPIDEWIITHYHFGKDLSEKYSGQNYHLTFDEVATGLVRFYSKKTGNNTTHRIEKTITPNSSLSEEIDKIIESREEKQDLEKFS